MKNFIVFFSFILVLNSCSNSDISEGGENLPEPVFSIPLNTGNWWTYNVVGNGTTNRDSLFISGDTLISSYVNKKFKAKNNIAIGFYSSSLKNNGVRKENNILYLTGSLAINQIQTLPINLVLDVQNFIIFKSGAATQEILSTKTGSFQQTINNNPLTIDYTLTSLGGTSFTSFTSPNGINYSDVKSTKIKLNIKITSSQIIAGFPVTITYLQPQDVLISTLYTAKNIGVVYVNTDTSYSLPQFVATELGIPLTSSQNQKEFLHTFNVN